MTTAADITAALSEAQVHACIGADFGANVIKIEPPGTGAPLRKRRSLKGGAATVNARCGGAKDTR